MYRYGPYVCCVYLTLVMELEWKEHLCVVSKLAKVQMVQRTHTITITTTTKQSIYVHVHK